jgi:transposase/IS5 family transposase
MSVPKPKVQKSFFDTDACLGRMFKGSDRYRIFNETILPVLWSKRDVLAALYCEDNGRPAIEPVIALGATLLQFMEKCPDRQAADNARLHLGGKFALGLEIDDEPFHYSSLSNFRKRLVESEAQRVGFDAVLDALREAGLVKRNRRQRLDSTHVLGNVSKMSRLECMRETIRLFLVQVGKWGVEDSLPGWKEYFERYCESDVQWHRLDKPTLAQKFEQAGADALSLIGWLRLQPAEIRQHDKAMLLERVFLEQYDIEGGAPSRRKQEHSGGVKNPHDPEAQWSTKDTLAHKSWVGYKVQVSETVHESNEPKKKGEPTEQFITEVTTTEAIASDLDGMGRNLQAQSEHHEEVPAELYADAGYVTDDTMAAADEEGRELIGPARAPGNPRKLFDTTMFDIDVAKRSAICPAGHPSRQCSLVNDEYKGCSYYRFEWASLCDKCELQKQCTRRKDGRRQVSVGVHHDHLQKRRCEMKTEEFRRKMHCRNAIEGTISEFTRGGGRRTRYRGLARTTLANYFQGAAVNVGRWIRLMQWEMEEADSQVA